MIKILYVGGATAAEQGAVGTHTSGIIRALDSHGQVDLSGVFYANALPMALPEKSHLYKEPKLISKLGKIGKLIGIFFYTLFVRRSASTLGAEYIYIRFDPFFCFFSTFFLSKCKIIVEYNDLFMDQVVFSAERGQWGDGLSKKFRLSRLYRRFIMLSERKTFSNAYLVVAVTDGLLSYCQRVGRGVKGVVIKNATDVKVSAPLNNEGAEQTLRIAHVGTLTYWDGLDELLAAISLSYKKSSVFNCRLVIVGDGKMKPILHSRVAELNLEDTVEFFGPMPREKAIEYLADTDVVPVLKTIVNYGLSPMKFYEAMGAGCHVIASDVPHMNEEDTKYVTTVSFPLDVEQIADKLLLLHKRLTEIRASRLEIVHHANVNHSWASRVRVLVDCLDRSC